MDGIIGVLLGLYICSHPAANMLDALFFERRFQRPDSSRWSGISWLALNILVLLVGWLVITIGATQLTARAA
jgi:type II secretory pathway component PulL